MASTRKGSPSDGDILAAAETSEIDTLVLELEREKAKAAREKRENRRLIRTLREELEHREQQLGIILGLQEAESEPHVITPHRKGGIGDAIAWAIASDWHVEEVVDPDTVSGLNEHNLEISDKKIERFYQHVLQLVELNRNSREIRQLCHPQ